LLHCRSVAPAKCVRSRWRQLDDGDALYQPLRERLGPYQSAIIEFVNADRPLSTDAPVASGRTTTGYPRISELPNLAT
jgi:hypothetical protein